LPGEGLVHTQGNLQLPHGEKAKETFLLLHCHKIVEDLPEEAPIPVRISHYTHLMG